MGKLQTNPTNLSLHWIHWIYPDRVQVMLGLPGSPATDVVLVKAPTSKRSGKKTGTDGTEKTSRSDMIRS